VLLPIPGLRRREAVSAYPIRQSWHLLLGVSEIAGPFLLAAQSIVSDNRVVAETHGTGSIRSLTIASRLGFLETASCVADSPDELDGRKIKPARDQVLCIDITLCRTPPCTDVKSVCTLSLMSTLAPTSANCLTALRLPYLTTGEH
jgi:hypothetical protein